MNIRWQVQWLELLGITKPNIIEKSKLYHLIHFFLTQTKDSLIQYFVTHDIFFCFDVRNCCFITFIVSNNQLSLSYKNQKWFWIQFCWYINQKKRRKHTFLSIPQNCLMLTIICMRYKLIWSAEENNFARSEICLSEDGRGTTIWVTIITQ